MNRDMSEIILCQLDVGWEDEGERCDWAGHSGREVTAGLTSPS